MRHRKVRWGRFAAALALVIAVGVLAHLADGDLVAVILQTTLAAVLTLWVIEPGDAE